MGSNQFEGLWGGRSRQGQQPGCSTWDWRKVQIFILKTTPLHAKAYRLGSSMCWPKKGRWTVFIVYLKGDEDRLGRCLSRGLHMHHCIHGHRRLLVEWKFVHFWLLRDLCIRLRVINMPSRFAMKFMFKSSRRSWPRKKIKITKFGRDLASNKNNGCVRADASDQRKPGGCQCFQRWPGNQTRCRKWSKYKKTCRQLRSKVGTRLPGKDRRMGVWSVAGEVNTMQWCWCLIWFLSWSWLIRYYVKQEGWIAKPTSAWWLEWCWSKLPFSSKSFQWSGIIFPDTWAAASWMWAPQSQMWRATSWEVLTFLSTKRKYSLDILCQF